MSHIFPSQIEDSFAISNSDINLPFIESIRILPDLEKATIS
ncbi:hypothetical protein ES705_06141 [subsurface metagenome]